MLDKTARAEIAAWTKQNALVRTVYQMESEVFHLEDTFQLNKRRCIIEGCTEATKSRSGVCRAHDYLLKLKNGRHVRP